MVGPDRPTGRSISTSGDEVFQNQWHAYRTREHRVLATQSDWHAYLAPRRYAIVVKIIDIFGIDTTKLAEVRIK